MCILGHSKNHRKGEPVLARNQTTNLLTQVRRKHRYSSLHEVHARRSLTSVTIKRGVNFNEMRDVGDMHSNIISAVIIFLDRESIVKVTSANRVDCENAVFPEVTASFYLTLGNPER